LLLWFALPKFYCLRRYGYLWRRTVVLTVRCRRDGSGYHGLSTLTLWLPIADGARQIDRTYLSHRSTRAGLVYGSLT